jgi:hypothetical protein
MPAATWHMVGFVQFFFIVLPPVYRLPKKPILVRMAAAGAPKHSSLSINSKWTNE